MSLVDRIRAYYAEFLQRRQELANKPDLGPQLPIETLESAVLALPTGPSSTEKPSRPLSQVRLIFPNADTPSPTEDPPAEFNKCTPEIYSPLLDPDGPDPEVDKLTTPNLPPRRKMFAYAKVSVGDTETLRKRAKAVKEEWRKREELDGEGGIKREEHEGEGRSKREEHDGEGRGKREEQEGEGRGKRDEKDGEGRSKRDEKDGEGRGKREEQEGEGRIKEEQEGEDKNVENKANEQEKGEKNSHVEVDGGRQNGEVETEHKKEEKQSEDEDPVITFSPIKMSIPTISRPSKSTSEPRLTTVQRLYTSQPHLTTVIQPLYTLPTEPIFKPLAKPKKIIRLKDRLLAHEDEKLRKLLAVKKVKRKKTRSGTNIINVFIKDLRMWCFSPKLKPILELEVEEYSESEEESETDTEVKISFEEEDEEVLEKKKLENTVVEGTSVPTKDDPETPSTTPDYTTIDLSTVEPVAGPLVTKPDTTFHESEDTDFISELRKPCPPRSTAMEDGGGDRPGRSALDPRTLVNNRQSMRRAREHLKLRIEADKKRKAKAVQKIRQRVKSGVQITVQKMGGNGGGRSRQKSSGLFKDGIIDKARVHMRGSLSGFSENR